MTRSSSIGRGDGRNEYTSPPTSMASEGRVSRLGEESGIVFFDDIGVTFVTGSGHPRGNKAAVDRLDDHQTGNRVVANGGGLQKPAVPQVSEIERATHRNRTGDLLVTN